MSKSKKKKWQVGNFFIELIQIGVGYGQKIEALVISDNEKNWKVQIPQHWTTFLLMKDLVESEDKTEKDILSSILTNIHCVTCVMDGKYQKDVFNAGVSYVERLSGEKPEIDEEYEDTIIRQGEMEADIQDYEDLR